VRASSVRGETFRSCSGASKTPPRPPLCNRRSRAGHVDVLNAQAGDFESPALRVFIHVRFECLGDLLALEVERCSPRKIEPKGVVRD
jgi:hypothetical protein